MSKPIGIGQSHSLVQALTNNVDWSKVSSETAQWIIEHAGEVEMTAFINNRAKLIVGEPKIIQIDRTKPFDPATFIGEGWSFWRGPADGDGITGEIEQDASSPALTELDLVKVMLKTCLKSGKYFLAGEEFLKRLRVDGGIQLDAGIFQTIWENKNLFPQKWKETTNSQMTYVFFFGSPLRSLNGSRCVLCLSWGSGELYWSYRCLASEWMAHGLAAVCAK